MYIDNDNNDQLLYLQFCILPEDYIEEKYNVVVLSAADV